MKRQSGFTLVELLIVVAILGIIAAVAIPSYASYIRKSKRSEAIVMLSRVAGEQHQYFSENNSFADKLTLLGYSATTTPSETGLYTISLVGTASSFTLTATPVTGKGQDKDAECANFTLNSIGTKGVSGTASAVDCW